MSAGVLVIGGGPAGSVAAVTARRRGLDVCLLERARPPFRKVCGEFLSRPGMEIFERVTGISRGRFPRLDTALFRSPASPRSRARRTPVLRLDPPAWGVPRSTLDTELLNVCLSLGVDVRLGWRAVREEFRDGMWLVSARPAGTDRIETFRARHLVRADGRRPAVSRRHGWTGRKTYGAGAPAGADIEISLLAGGAYYGRSMVEGGASNLCGLAHAPSPPWEDEGDAIAAVPLAADSGQPPIATARFSLGWQAPRDRASFVVGDALATWPPLVGDGMTMAMTSAALLGARLGDAGFGPAEWIDFWRGRHAHLLDRSLALHAALENEVWKSALFGAVSLWRPLGDWLIQRARFADAG